MSAAKPPNVLFVLGEDWGRYASAYARHGAGDPTEALNELVRTPAFDRIAKDGVLFLNARTPAPGCNPCRSSLMSGQYFWQTGLGAIEQGTAWDKSIPTFPLELEKAGYFLGYSYEGECGKTKAYVGGDDRDAELGFHDAGRDFGNFSLVVAKQAEKIGVDAAKTALFTEVRGNFQAFLKKRESVGGRPFCYCWGPTTTHREWHPGSGKTLWGIDPDQLERRLPECWPDVHVVREDLSDYLGECCALDRGLAELLAELEERNELENTLIVVTGDHGMPGLPRAKATLHDLGCQVPLAVCWPGRIPGGRVVEDLVNTMDLASTVCDAAGVHIPGQMQGCSLMPLLTSTRNGQVQPERDFVVSGLERHVCIAREGYLPYPQRSMRTNDFLYIRSFKPDRWPMGDPFGLNDFSINLDAETLHGLEHQTMLAFPDFDAGRIKAWIVEHRSEPSVSPFYEIAFGKRSAVELYDLRKDKQCMRNVAGEKAYVEAEQRMASRLRDVMASAGDPREVENSCRYEAEPYAGLMKKYKTEDGQAFLRRLDVDRSKWQTRRAKL